jgi:hypothetical protein
MFLILKPEESGLFQNSHELMGWRITIRSSRDRFAASLVALSCSTPLGRCASRLNSGVINLFGGTHDGPAIGTFFFTPLLCYWGYRFIKNDISFLKVKDD